MICSSVEPRWPHRPSPSGRRTLPKSGGVLGAQVSRGAPLLSLFAGLVIGPLICRGSLSFVGRRALLYSDMVVSPSIFLEDLQFWYSAITSPFSTSKALLIPAMFIYIWLLLLAIGALGARQLDPIFRTVAWAQPLIRQGYTNPLRVIGLVATGLTIIVMTVITMVI